MLSHGVVIVLFIARCVCECDLPQCTSRDVILDSRVDSFTLFGCKPNDTYSWNCAGNGKSDNCSISTAAVGGVELLTITGLSTPQIVNITAERAKSGAIVACRLRIASELAILLHPPFRELSVNRSTLIQASVVDRLRLPRSSYSFRWEYPNGTMERHGDSVTLTPTGLGRHVIRVRVSRDSPAEEASIEYGFDAVRTAGSLLQLGAILQPYGDSGMSIPIWGQNVTGSLTWNCTRTMEDQTVFQNGNEFYTHLVGDGNATCRGSVNGSQPVEVKPFSTQYIECDTCKPTNAVINGSHWLVRFDRSDFAEGHLFVWFSVSTADVQVFLDGCESILCPFAADSGQYQLLLPVSLTFAGPVPLPITLTAHFVDVSSGASLAISVDDSIAVNASNPLFGGLNTISEACEALLASTTLVSPSAQRASELSILLPSIDRDDLGSRVVTAIIGTVKALISSPFLGDEIYDMLLSAAAAAANSSAATRKYPLSLEAAIETRISSMVSNATDINSRISQWISSRYSPHAVFVRAAAALAIRSSVLYETGSLIKSFTADGLECQQDCPIQLSARTIQDRDSRVSFTSAFASLFLDSIELPVVTIYDIVVVMISHRLSSILDTDWYIAGSIVYVGLRARGSDYWPADTYPINATIVLTPNDNRTKNWYCVSLPYLNTYWVREGIVKASSGEAVHCEVSRAGIYSIIPVIPFPKPARVVESTSSRTEVPAEIWIVFLAFLPVFAISLFAYRFWKRRKMFAVLKDTNEDPTDNSGGTQL